MALTRAAFLDRVRRAFLLRAHPDRFRNESHAVQRQQARLVQALSNRMSQNDFAQWQNNDTRNHYKSGVHSSSSDECLTFALKQERRDGTLFQSKLYLNRTVEEILHVITQSLQKCGAGATLPELSILSKPSSNPNMQQTQQQQPSEIHFSSSTGPAASSSFSKRDYQRYNVKSNEGRNLMRFVQNGVNAEDVMQRKLDRTNAQAAALAVRRLYQFQAVDPTSLGWSSAATAILLKRLLELHQEHSFRFHVDSFYPLRLLFTPFDQVEERRHAHLKSSFSNSENHNMSTPSTTFTALDVYAGVLRLHPASTPLQWLEHIQEVTEESLELVRQRRSELDQYKGLIRSRHNLRLHKGFSCTSRDYYHVLQQLCLFSTTSGQDNISYPASHELIPEPVVVTVESPEACRRHHPTVTPEGTVRISKEMLSRSYSGSVAGDDHKSVALLDKIVDLTTNARERRTEFEHQKTACQALAKEIQWQLGLPKAVYRTGVVKQEDFMASLHRMRQHLGGGEEPDAVLLLETLKLNLAGTALSITGSGHFCHLADDGTVVIPHDWK